MGKSLKVGDKQVVEKIDFTLPRGAVITGRVLDEYGEPIADVQVSALRNQFTALGRRPVNAAAICATNDIGEFRLFGLSPGQYFCLRPARIQMGRTTNGDSLGIRRHLLSRERPNSPRPSAEVGVGERYPTSRSCSPLLGPLALAEGVRRPRRTINSGFVMLMPRAPAACYARVAAE